MCFSAAVQRPGDRVGSLIDICATALGYDIDSNSSELDGRSAHDDLDEPANHRRVRAGLHISIGRLLRRPCLAGRIRRHPPAWTDSGEPPADLVDPDVDGDGSPDRIVIHENGDLQVDLGDAGWTSLLTAYTSYELADTADLDGDGDEELLLQRNGNNYGGIEVAYVSDCDLQLALSTERDDTAFYGNWCSSSSCAGTIKRTDCMLDGSGSFIRHHVMSVPDDQLDDWKSGMIAEATWNYTVTDHRLIDGVMTTEVVQETMQLSESEAFATMGNPGLGPDCRVR